MANDMHANGRDIRNGTYDAILPSGKEQPTLQIRENPSPHEGPRHGSDVRSESMPGTEDPISEGLLRERKGPLSAQTGRRHMD
jgi:hypothetical protein